MVEMMEQRDWRAPDWVVLPGGNLGNTSAFGKGLREMQAAGLDLPPAAPGRGSGRRLRAILRSDARRRIARVWRPWHIRETLATAIKIGDPVSWPKALREVQASGGVVERVTRAGNCRCQGRDRARAASGASRLRRPPWQVFASSRRPG